MKLAIFADLDILNYNSYVQLVDSLESDCLQVFKFYAYKQKRDKAFNKLIESQNLNVVPHKSFVKKNTSDLTIISDVALYLACNCVDGVVLALKGDVLKYLTTYAKDRVKFVCVASAEIVENVDFNFVIQNESKIGKIINTTNNNATLLKKQVLDKGITQKNYDSLNESINLLNNDSVYNGERLRTGNVESLPRPRMLDAQNYNNLSSDYADLIENSNVEDIVLKYYGTNY